MSLAIRNTQILSQQNPTRFTSCEAKLIAIDALALAACAVVAALIVTGQIHASVNVAYGLYGIGGSILVANAITSLKRAYLHPQTKDRPKYAFDPEFTVDRCRQMVLEALAHLEQFPVSGITSTINESRKVPCHEILPGLFLGGITAFVDATGLPCVDPDEIGRPTIVRDTSNPHGFSTIISMTFTSGISGDHISFDGVTDTQLKSAFEKQGIRWCYLGKALFDIPNPKHRFGPPQPIPDNAKEIDRKTWRCLVHDATFPSSQLANTELVDANDAVKDKKSNKMCVSEEIWFEPTFQEIDAIFERGRVLVHCQAGISRSPALIIAWMVKRLNISVEQAIEYIRFKRLCVDTMFAPYLTEYERALRSQA